MTDFGQTTASTHALQVTQMWAKLPPEHLEFALEALEPELRREHEHRLELLRDELRWKRCSASEAGLIIRLEGFAAGHRSAGRILKALMPGVRGSMAR